MPRAARPTKPPHRPSSAKSNAAGYAKRKAQPPRAARASAADVYEYQPERVRRATVQLQLEKDELRGAGRGGESDGEGSEAGVGRAKPRLVGEDDEDGIAEEEDEELDSDAAFEESDEERYAGFSFASSKKSQPKKKSKAKPSQSKAVRFAEVDLNEDTDMEDAKASQSEGGSDDEDEDEEEEEEGEPDEFIDVLDMLDGRGEADSGDDIGEVEKEGDKGDEEEGEEASDEAESEDEDEVDEEDIADVSPEEDEMDTSALDQLDTFITSLDAGQKRKAPEDGEDTEAADDKRKRRRRLLKEQTQAGAESEFAAQAGASKLSLDDLLAPLDASSSNLQSLKKSAKALAASSSKAKTLSAPLPQRAQERLDREAAYEQTKEEIDKWSATMKRIKEAEHLSFPLQAEPAGRTSNLELTAKFKPVTEMESAVDKLLKSAKMREQDLAQTEALKMNHLSVEEVAARRAELAKMRELMFRAEAKAKRVAKIKSKTYRRLRKKEQARLAAKLGGGSDAEGEDDEAARLRREVDRARERATLRHKNTGKWARAMKGRGELDADQRREINEMLDRGEKLRRRIQGRGSDESGSGSEDETEEEGEDGVRRIKAGAFDELRQLEGGGAGADVPEGKKGKSVFEMKFMKDAMARNELRAKEIADDFVRELGGQMGEDDDEEGEGEGDAPPASTTQRVGGRMSFRPGNIPELSRALPSLASDTSSVTLKSTDMPNGSQPTSPAAASPVLPRADAPPAAPAAPPNPWLAAGADGGSRGAQKKHEVAVGKGSADADKARHKLRKRAQKRGEEKARAQDEAAVEVSMADVMTLGAAGAHAEAGPSKSPQKSALQKKALTKAAGAAGAGADDEEEDAHSEVEEQERALQAKGKGRAKGVKAFEQRDLVARAFAGDNVVQEFAEAKRREIQEDAPKEVDTTLPGWGSWGGAGTKKAAPKPYLIKKVAGVDPTTRADHKKAHVIISEKRDKKAAKYQVKDLPFPYTSKAQFERSMDTPIGAEWNTRVGFQRGTLPKVVKKPGVVIAPLEKLL